MTKSPLIIRVAIATGNLCESLPMKGGKIIMIKIPKFPTHIQLQTHSLCNLKCKLCPHPSLGLNSNKKVMDDSLFKKLINEAILHDEFKSIVLDLQNEALLDPRLAEKVSYIKKKNKDIFVGITTNGVLLKEKVVRRLIDSGIDRIVISLNATNSDEFKEIVDDVSFSKILSNLQDSLRVKGAGNIILVSFGVTKSNVYSLTNFVRVFEDKNVMYRYFKMNDRLGYVDNTTIIKLENLDCGVDEDSSLEPLLHNVRKRKSCQIPAYSLAIKLDGTVILCCEDWTEKKKLGNVFETSIASVWNSDEYTSIRNDLINSGKLPNNPCGNCDSPKTLPFPTVNSLNDMAFKELQVGFFSSEVKNSTDIIPTYTSGSWFFKNVITGNCIKSNETAVRNFEINPTNFILNTIEVENLNKEALFFLPLPWLNVDGEVFTGNYYFRDGIISLEGETNLQYEFVGLTIKGAKNGVHLELEGVNVIGNKIRLNRNQRIQMEKYLSFCYGLY